jgi:hypothetical protein
MMSASKQVLGKTRWAGPATAGRLLTLSVGVLGCGGLASDFGAAGRGVRDVGNPPVIEHQPMGRTVTVGGYMAFAVTVSTTSQATYQWRRDGLPLTNGVGVAGTDTSLLTIEPVTNAHGGAYSVAVTNQGGGVISSEARLTVNPLRVTPALTNGGRDYVIRTSTQPGDACRIEVSVNFSPFQTVGHVTNYQGTAEFIDRGPFGSGFRQYRAVLVRTSPVLVIPTGQARPPTRLVGYGRRGETYRVEASSNFQNWEIVATNSDLSGWVDVTDTVTPRPWLRFYRIVTP